MRTVEEVRTDLQQAYDPASQATRQGWPYYPRAARTACGGVVYSRATPIGVNLRPPQATRQGWPYYPRAARTACGGVVYSRATPGGWPALSTCDGGPAYGNLRCRPVTVGQHTAT